MIRRSRCGRATRSWPRLSLSSSLKRIRRRPSSFRLLRRGIGGSTSTTPHGERRQIVSFSAFRWLRGWILNQRPLGISEPLGDERVQAVSFNPLIWPERQFVTTTCVLAGDASLLRPFLLTPISPFFGV